MVAVRSAQYELVAYVVKTRGLEGEVMARAVDGLPFALHEGLSVYVVPPTLDGPRELVVKSVQENAPGSFRVQFEEIDSIDLAEQIAGRHLLALVSDIRQEDGFEFQDEIGRSVHDERYGALGVIEELICTPANDVWVVQGAYGEVLIPVIEDVVLEIPEDIALPIATRIMDGLIEGDRHQDKGDKGDSPLSPGVSPLCSICSVEGDGE